jgi:hypothetical protein
MIFPIEIPLPLILEIAAAIGVYALIARRSAPSRERKPLLPVKTDAPRPAAGVAATTQARA